jgi:hypothetical protein
MIHTFSAEHQVGVNFVGDCVCAFAPLFVVMRLSRSTVERILLSFSMALGIAATVTNTIRVKHLRTYADIKTPTFRDQFEMYLLTRVEELILLVAASAPFLKSAIERLLSRWDLPTFQNPVTCVNLNSHHTTAGNEMDFDERRCSLDQVRSRSTTKSANVLKELEEGDIGCDTTISISSKEQSSSHI